jgi:hypothetical protein
MCGLGYVGDVCVRVSVECGVLQAFRFNSQRSLFLMGEVQCTVPHLLPRRLLLSAVPPLHHPARHRLPHRPPHPRHLLRTLHPMR